jgi:hypothetical protein
MSTFDLNKLLSESSTPLDALLQQSRGLAKKWEKTGLLEGLKQETDRGNMAVLLENQARQLVTETTKTGGANAEQWNGVALPLVRKVFAEIAAKEFVSVQPMNLPSGLIFYMDFQYGTGVKPMTVGDSMYGTTSGSATVPTGGLYGAGRFAYTLNDWTASVTVNTSGSATSASVNFDADILPNLASLALYQTSASNLSGADLTTVRSFVPLTGAASGTALTGWLPGLTTLNANQTVITFVASVINPAQVINAIQYTKQPTDSTRGDFEDTVGSSIPPTGVDLNIPEINLQLRSEPIVAKTRKLKAVWTPELAQDLNAYHSIDAEAELTAMLSEYISLEIDLEILDMLIANAQTTGRWSNTIGKVWSTAASGFVNDTNISGQAWTQMTWNQTLGIEIQRVSNKIHQLTLRGGANWMVVSPTVASIIEVIPGFTAKTDGNQSDFAMGVSQVGSFQNRFQVYKNPYFSGNLILMGFRGSNFLETGAVYAPYIPLIMTPLVYDPQNFTPRRGVLTRYAKKIVRPEFYGKIIVDGVQSL